MAQHDYNIANNPGAAVRADINALAEAIASLNSGSSAPSITFPNMWWIDNTNSLLKIRNNANTSWITVAAVGSSTIILDSGALALPVSGSWFGTQARVPQIDTSGILEIGSTLDFHPDAAGTEDYRLRVARAAGVDGGVTITNTGAGGINFVPGAGGLNYNGAPLDIIPVGLIAAWAWSVAPSRWLLMFGQNVSRTTYAALFALFGTTFGAGDGSTTFGMPDVRGRTIAGLDNMGGSAALRLTGLSGGVVGTTLGAAGGVETHTLTLAQLAAHAHNGSGNTGTESADHSHTTTLNGYHGANGAAVQGWSAGNVTDYTGFGIATGGRSAAHTHAYSFTSSSSGSDGAHNNVQPTFMAGYIIYAGV